jgi:hypothetical protein
VRGESRIWSFRKSSSAILFGNNVIDRGLLHQVPGVIVRRTGLIEALGNQLRRELERTQRWRVVWAAKDL